jgi:hypothetical protein
MMSTRADFPVLTYVHSQAYCKVRSTYGVLHWYSMLGRTSYMVLGDLEYCLNWVSKSGDSTRFHFLYMEYMEYMEYIGTISLRLSRPHCQVRCLRYTRDTLLVPRSD